MIPDELCFGCTGDFEDPDDGPLAATAIVCPTCGASTCDECEVPRSCGCGSDVVDAMKREALAGPLYSCAFRSCAEQVSFPPDMLAWALIPADKHAETLKGGWVCDPCAEARTIPRAESLADFLGRQSRA